MIQSQDASIGFGSRTIGRARVKYVFPHSALYPTLGIQLGISLGNVVGATSETGDALRDFEIRGLDGELRSEQNQPIGPTRWVKDTNTYVRSSDYLTAENEVRLICDLDPYRLSKIEKERNGKGPAFQLHLWPVAFHAGKPLELTISSLQLRIAVETWVELLKTFQGDGYELIEVRYKTSHGEAFRKAVSCLASARANRDRGAYDPAAADCRLALEAMQSGIGLPERAGKADWQRVFERGTKERTAKELVDTFTAFKGLTHLAHHFRENADETFRPDYSRAEVNFIIRCTEEFIALVSELSAKGE